MNAKSEEGADSSEALNFGVPSPIANAVRRAAANELITKAAYARRAVMVALRRDGFLPDRQADHPAFKVEGLSA